ncbi:hypothetical protein EJ08DRAFT_526987 [Tothia fuscella]|uniref:Oxidase ustYa n=1 Tax=Tothia fuscella TaxID=1048955 RepID=A0A9P4TTC9_9PEZI|nr:hypothetical protein EJ08DRAFT_526987 [Tothia fuscella]
MSRFNSRRDEHSPAAYDRVVDEESKPLHVASSDSENEHQTTAEIYALNRAVLKTNLYLRIVIGLLSATLFALLFLQSPATYKTFKELKKKPILKTPVPEIPMQKTIFRENELYSARPNATTDAAWDALLPPGRGFVFVPDHEKYDLPEGEDTPWGMIYSVAVFHQMHCLGQLRRFTWMFLDAIVANDTDTQRGIVKLFHEGNHASHVHHCFDYLRQTISCAGDMTMEWPRTEKDGRKFAVDGWEIPHECKSQDAIMDYMDKNHFNYSMNSMIAPIDDISKLHSTEGGEPAKPKVPPVVAL